jgi:hypothetical protein
MVFDALTLRRAPYALRHIRKKARSHPSRRMKAGLPPIGSARSLPAECRRLGDGGSNQWLSLRIRHARLSEVIECATFARRPGRTCAAHLPALIFTP